MIMPTDCAGAIIAGGRSSRMGVSKEYLSHNGQTLLANAQNTLKQAGLRQIFISHDEHTADIFKGLGPLGGIHAVMSAAPAAINNIVFVPVDMPALSAPLLQPLINAPNSALAIRYSRFAFPFRLTHTDNVRQKIEKRLQTKENLSLTGLQNALGVTELPIPKTAHGEFVNINTQTDWQNFLAHGETP